MRNRTILFLAAVFIAAPAFPRHTPSLCGTRPGNWREEQFLHRQAARERAVRRARLGIKLAPQASAAARDSGNIVILEDADGVVARRNEFNLDQRTVTFSPVGAGAARYRYDTGGPGYDTGAADAGTPLTGLGDDDSRPASLPFAFPFYGATYSQVFINSDGNLTFTAGDGASTDRSLGRVTAGPPRIAPLFDDLDPSTSVGGVRVLSEPGRFVVSWARVPEWQDSGPGTLQTFQVRLYPDGRIEFAYNGVFPSAAVAGIAPGRVQGSTSLVSFANDPSGEYSGAVAERFGGDLELDITTAAQKFYETHEDAYDYLVFFNNLDISAGGTAVAYESTVRNSGKGFGDEPVDVGREFGSRARLQAVMNLGPLSQYPTDPYATVRARGSTGDTPVTVIAHEAGHRFLAFASVRDPGDPFARPMLGYQNAHWFFGFNSEASLLEGNRIRDNGPAVSPRFETTGTVEGFSPLDQYLMGLRPAGEVEPEHQIFYATGTPPTFARLLPRKGYTFDGGRRDVHMDELIQTIGRRTPDHTVAQRRFRFAFVLVVPKGGEPPAADLAKVEGFRAAFEDFFRKATGDRATADASLKLNLKLSLAPAAGVLAGRTASATLAVDTPPAAPLTVELRTSNGTAGAPRSVTIPAGATSAAFEVSGIRAGVEELLAVPGDPRYSSEAARIRVADPAEIRIAAVSGERQAPVSSGPLPDAVVVRVTDINELPYPGVRISAAPSDSGSVAPASVVTDAAGTASFRWTPGAAPANQLRFSMDGGTATLSVAAGPRVVRVASVSNAAFASPTVAPGALASLYGANLAAGAAASAALPWPAALAGTRVLLNGAAVPLTYVSEGQINFLVPASQQEGTAQLTVENALGASAALPVRVAPVAPGIFAVVAAGTADLTTTRPVSRGDWLEIYCTGLGPVQAGANGLSLTTLQPQVTIGGLPASVSYSGLAPGFDGLYQVNVSVPPLQPGEHTLTLNVHGTRSNDVKIGVR